MKVLTVGSFDIFHSGHVHLLRTCRERAGVSGVVVAGVNTSEFIAKFKQKPVNPLAERLAVVQACRYVDKVIVNDSESLQEMILRERPEYLLVGSDWAPPRDYAKQIGCDARWLEAHGVALQYVERAPDSISSTSIRNAAADHQAYVLGGRGGHR